jgi:hypothetical protein
MDLRFGGVEDRLLWCRALPLRNRTVVSITKYCDKLDVYRLNQWTTEFLAYEIYTRFGGIGQGRPPIGG